MDFKVAPSITFEQSTVGQKDAPNRGKKIETKMSKIRQ